MGLGYLIDLWFFVSLLLMLFVTVTRCSQLGFTFWCWAPGSRGFVPTMISDSWWKLVKVKAGSTTPPRGASGYLRQTGVGALWKRKLAGTLLLSEDLNLPLTFLSFSREGSISLNFLSSLNPWLWHIELVTFRLTNTMKSSYWLILSVKIYKDTQLPNFFQSRK